jgi:PKD repeat protein
LILFPDDVVPEVHNVSKWRAFQPPIVPFSIVKSLKTVSEEFKDELAISLKSGHKNQHAQLGVIYSKIIQHSYAVVESVNKIVEEGKEALLKAGTIIFLENACCEEKEQRASIQFFINKNPNIQKYLDFIRKNGAIMEEIKMMSRAAYISPGTRTMSLLSTSNYISEENIYTAFIHYCKLLSKQSLVPDDMRIFFQEKPGGMQPQWDLNQTIDHLKKIGKKFDADSLKQLMQIVARRNIIHGINTSAADIQYTRAFSDLVTRLSASETPVIEPKLTDYLKIILDKFNINSPVDKDLITMEKMKKHLSRANRQMRAEIMGYINEFGTTRTLAEKGRINAFLENLTTWSCDTNMKLGVIEHIDEKHAGKKYTVRFSSGGRIENFENREWDFTKKVGDNVYVICNNALTCNSTEIMKSKSYTDEGQYKVIQYIKNAVFMITKTVPAIITNSEHGTRKVEASKHWDLSEKHINVLQGHIDKYFDKLHSYVKDNLICRFFRDINMKLVDLNLFLNYIPVFTAFINEDKLYYLLFDKEALYLLHSYCYYSVLYELVTGSDTDEYLKLDMEEVRTMRKTMKAADNDVVIGTADEEEDLSEYPDEVDISAGNRMEFRQRVCDLLMIMIEMDMLNKKTIDKPYEDLLDKSYNESKREKATITDYLKNMTIEERRVENILKAYKMGRWNLGEQKGVYKYDQNLYDAEKSEEGDLYAVREDQPEEVDPEHNDYDPNAEAEREAEDEENNIEGLDEDYNDGVYYQEDRDE